MEDYKVVKIITNNLIKAIENMEKTHYDIFKDGRFGKWAFNAFLNMIVHLSKMMNISKKELKEIIDKYWEDKNKVLN